MRDRGRRKWWISGCLVVVAIVALGVATVAGLIWWSVRSADLQSSTLVHQTGGGNLAESSRDGTTAAGTPLSVLLELDSCEVYIEPGEPGEPLNIEAHYDARDYVLEELVDEADPGAYRLRFRVTASRLITGIKQGLRGGQPQLRVRLPTDTPIELKLVQRNGGAIVDLSGLHLTDARFDIGGALLKVDADEPLTGELERFHVVGGHGALVVESLNLMRPRNVEIDFRMGEMQLDFRGRWAADTNVDLSMSLTDTIVRLPRKARIEGIGERRLKAPSSDELRPPTLRFTVEAGKRTDLRVFE